MAATASEDLHRNPEKDAVIGENGSGDSSGTSRSSSASRHSPPNRPPPATTAITTTAAGTIADAPPSALTPVASAGSLPSVGDAGAVGDGDGSGSGNTAPEAERTRLQTIVIMMSLCSALFLAALDYSIITVAIPAIAEDLHSTVGYTWIGSAYLLANAATAPSWGKISDIWGRKQILLIATGVFWVGSLLCAVSVNMGMLVASRAIQGIGGGGVINLVNITISDLFSLRKRGQYLAWTGLVWAVAGGLGPVVGGVFTTKVSWRWCFYINLPIAGIGMIVLIFVLKLHNPRTPIGQGLAAVDWLGSLTVTGGTVMFLMGLTFGGVVYPWTSPTVLCLLIFGIVLLVLFVIVEWKFAEFPIVPLRMFKQRAAVAALGCSFCHGFVFISGTYYLPLYFQAVLGASPLLSGLYILPFTVSLAVVSAISGLVIKKTGKYLPTIIVGFVLMTLGYALYIDLGATPTWAKIILYQLVAGIGTGPNFQSPLIALHNTIEQRDIASATGMFGFIRQLSTSISVVAGGVAFQNGMQKQVPRLVASLGPEVAALLAGDEAAANVGFISQLQGAAGEEARGAYWISLREMWVMYVAFAGLGLVIACFIGQKTLSREHTEHKTGLQAMREANLKAQEDGAARARLKEREKVAEKDEELAVVPDSRKKEET